LGAVLATQVTSHVRSGLDSLGIASTNVAGGGGVPNPANLPAPVATVVEHAYGIGTAWVFGISAVAALIGALVIPFIREVPLRTTNADPADALEAAALTVAASEGLTEDVPVHTSALTRT
jgi:hypothetical protein